MAYHIRERVFSLADTFDIVDDYGNPVYQVRGRVFAMGKTLDLFDMNDRHCIEIHQRLLTFLPEYEFKVNGEIVGRVKKSFTLLTPKYEIDGPDCFYTMQGDWIELKYTISDGMNLVASISREFAIFAKTYGVEVAPGADVPLMLAIAIVMEEVSQDQPGSGLGNLMDDV